MILHALASALLLALHGIVTGLWAQKMDHLSAATNFVVVPLTFLSGIFYSIGDLPRALEIAALVNPFFYMMDGIRYGFIGRADGSLAVGLAVMLTTSFALGVLCFKLIKTGWRIRS